MMHAKDGQPGGEAWAVRVGCIPDIIPSAIQHFAG
jgi:hypothetical protein